MGNSRAKTLNVSALSWALRVAVRYSIAIAVVAMLIAIFLPDMDAERFATTAYLAGIFAAVALAATWSVPAGAAQPQRPATRSLGGLLGYAAGFAVLLFAAASLAGDAGAELALFLGCLAAIGITAIGPGRAVAWLHGELVRGGGLAAAIGYSAVVTFCAIVVCALVPSEIAEPFAVLAYAAAFLATVLIAASLFVPTALGAFARSRAASASKTIDQLSADFVFARITNISVVTLVASLGLASLLRRPYSEPFAAVAYVAALSATLGVGMECRPGRAEPATISPRRTLASLVDGTAKAAKQFSRVLTVEGLIRGSAAASVAAFLLASLVLRRSGETFAVIGYLAAILSALGIGTQCRRTIRKRRVATP